jgi:hypothetical protein
MCCESEDASARGTPSGPRTAIPRRDPLLSALATLRGWWSGESAQPPWYGARIVAADRDERPGNAVRTGPVLTILCPTHSIKVSGAATAGRGAEDRFWCTVQEVRHREGLG